MKNCTSKIEKNLSPCNEKEEFHTQSIQALARLGAQQMLKIALESEIKHFVATHQHLVDSEGRQRIVRNGYHAERKIQTGVGDVSVSVPRSRDRSLSHPDEKLIFQSQIVPRYLRRTKEIAEFIPFLYLKGISSNDFSEVLSSLLGHEVSFSPSSVVEFKKVWENEYDEWSRQDLTGKRYIYWWVDGIYFNVRLGDDKRHCVLVIMGATEDGHKELISVDIGYRESELGWKEILLNLKARGLKEGPKLAIGDGALGFWKALKQVFPQTRHQRCWVHRTANVLEKMPKSVQPQAKRNIYDIYQAPTKKEALKAFDHFVSIYEAKYPKAVECLLKTKEETMAFYDFPAEHWRHIRTTNPIESTFATVRLRTYKTKGCGSRITTLTMVFKLAQAAQKKWHRLNGFNIIPMVFEGVLFKDGVRYAA